MRIKENKKVILDRADKKVPIFIKTHITDIKNTLNRIGQQYQEQQQTIKELREQLQNFKGQVYKDEELARLSQEYDRMKENYYNGFSITTEEKEKVHEWVRQHEDAKHGGYPAYHGASGGGYVYQFHPTGLGVAQYCLCNSCRRKAMEYSRGDWEKFNKLLKEFDAEFDFTGDW